MARVLIAGCGYLGNALGALLVGRGDAVWGLRRNPDRLAAGITPVAGDLTDPQTLASLPPGIDHLYYVAAADSGDETAYRRAYVQGLQNILTSLPGTVPRICFTSSTRVYGQSDGSWVDESTPARPADAQGHLLVQGEAMVQGAGGFCVRLGGLYGPGRTGLIERIRRGEARCVQEPPRYTNRIHRDDAARLLLHVMALDAPAPVYLGVDEEPASRCDVLDWLAARLGAPKPKRQPTADTEGRRGQNKRCRSALLRASDFRFDYPSFREGYEQVLAAEL